METVKLVIKSAASRTPLNLRKRKKRWSWTFSKWRRTNNKAPFLYFRFFSILFTFPLFVRPLFSLLRFLSLSNSYSSPNVHALSLSSRSSELLFDGRNLAGDRLQAVYSGEYLRSLRFVFRCIRFFDFETEQKQIERNLQEQSCICWEQEFEYWFQWSWLEVQVWGGFREPIQHSSPNWCVRWCCFLSFYFLSQDEVFIK